MCMSKQTERNRAQKKVVSNKRTPFLNGSLVRQKVNIIFANRLSVSVVNNHNNALQRPFLVLNLDAHSQQDSLVNNPQQPVS